MTAMSGSRLYAVKLQANKIGRTQLVCRTRVGVVVALYV